MHDNREIPFRLLPTRNLGLLICTRLLRVSFQIVSPPKKSA
jgi:hypothetical protein